MKKGLLIVERDGEEKIKLLENRLKEHMGAKESFLGEECVQWLLEPKRPESPGELVFRKGKGQRRLPLKRILYLEKQLRKVTVVLEEGENVSFYSEMQPVMEQLKRDFCQCHKSYAVNLNKVISLDEEGFRMKNGDLVPVSQRCRQEARFRYEEFQEEKNIEKLRFSKTFSCFEL